MKSVYRSQNAIFIVPSLWHHVQKEEITLCRYRNGHILLEKSDSRGKKSLCYYGKQKTNIQSCFINYSSFCAGLSYTHTRKWVEKCPGWFFNLHTLVSLACGQNVQTRIKSGYPVREGLTWMHLYFGTMEALYLSQISRQPLDTTMLICTVNKNARKWLIQSDFTDLFFKSMSLFVMVIRYSCGAVSWITVKYVGCQRDQIVAPWKEDYYYLSWYHSRYDLKWVVLFTELH